MGKRGWKPGTGAYMQDRSTYLVTDDDGGLVMVFAVNGTVGRGDIKRNVVQRGDALVVTTHYQTNGDDPLPEIVLTSGMKGWWDTSGATVFSEDDPGLTVPRLREERRGRLSSADTTVADGGEPEMQSGVASVPARPGTGGEQPELPALGQGVVDSLLREYKVGRGPGGVVLLFAGNRVIVPDESPGIFGGYLDPDSQYRFAFLRALRNSPLATQLEEVPYTKLPQEGYVQDGQGGNRATGWYWHTPSEDTFICARADGVRFSAGLQRRYSWNMAINNSMVTPQSLVGVVKGAAYVYPRARSNSDLELLVHCTRGGSREIILLTHGAESTRAEERKGLSLLSYRLTHTTNGGLFLDVANRDWHNPPYVVTFDTKGKARIFKRL